jgi:hypothetical protein
VAGGKRDFSQKWVKNKDIWTPETHYFLQRETKGRVEKVVFGLPILLGG